MRRLLPLVLFVLLFAAWIPAANAWTWPVDGAIEQGFSFDSAHPYAGGQHRGVDIGAAAGGPVVAPAAGTVTFAGSVPTNGLTVTIETDDGLAVTLTHLGSLAVARGHTGRRGRRDRHGRAYRHGGGPGAVRPPRDPRRRRPRRVPRPALAAAACGRSVGTGAGAGGRRATRSAGGGACIRAGTGTRDHRALTSGTGCRRLDSGGGRRLDIDQSCSNRGGGSGRRTLGGRSGVRQHGVAGRRLGPEACHPCHGAGAVVRARVCGDGAGRGDRTGGSRRGSACCGAIADGDPVVGRRRSRAHADRGIRRIADQTRLAAESRDARVLVTGTRRSRRRARSRDIVAAASRRPSGLQAPGRDGRQSTGGRRRPNRTCGSTAHDGQPAGDEHRVPSRSRCPPGTRRRAAAPL